MKRAILLAIGFLAAVMALYLVGRQWRLKPETAANHTLLRGETAILTVHAGNTVWLARNKEDCHALQAAMTSEDAAHLKACEDNQTAFAVPSGSKVKVLAASISRRQVEVLEGPLAGRVGWVEHEFLRPPKPGEVK